MSLRTLVAAYYAHQAATTDSASQAVLSLWALLDPATLFQSWIDNRMSERLFVAVSSRQLIAAESAKNFVPAAITAQNAASAPTATVQTKKFAGIAADGRDLEATLTQPLYRSLVAMKDGMPSEQAMTHGAATLRRIAVSEVADAAREATATAIQAEPAVTGWVRILTPPSCGRCAVLAGETHPTEEAFDRHPQCDCQISPAVNAQADHIKLDPDAYFRSLPKADQDQFFGPGRAEAIRQGGDIATVMDVNAKRAGMSTAGRGDNPNASLMPADLIRMGGGNRDKTVALLGEHGFLS